MDVDLEAVLAARKAQYKSTEVEKEVELQYDLGNLLATDLNPLDAQALKTRKDEYLNELTRDNAQLLINKIWQLPVEKTDGMVAVELPPPTTVLPREKPIPKAKAMTTWEKFSQAKGINKRKRSRMVFDETTQEWKARWGYKRIADPKDKWMIEVPDRSDPYQDYFEKQAEERKEKIAKNEFKRLKNISRTQKGTVKVPPPPPHTKDLSKHQLTQALGKAKASTASIGKFTEALPKEPVPKRTKRTKVAPVVGDLAAERRKNLDILSSVVKKRAVLDAEKAANRHTAMEQRSKSEKRGRVEEGGPAKKRSKPKTHTMKKGKVQKIRSRK